MTVPEATRGGLRPFLIETFGFWPQEGIRRWPLHRARLLRSAEHLGYPSDPQRLDAQVAGLSAEMMKEEAPRRCRLTLDDEGSVKIETSPMAPHAGPWTVELSPVRLRSDDLWLRIKSSNRALYDQVRQQIARPDHEVIFANERGELCEGTITNLFVEDAQGRRLTPALACGLLPGVLRQTLLDDGFAEAVLTLADLRAARKVWVGNSLRGLIPARLKAA
ncbi:4-amino-4-deoxychorismate lyase [Salipiger sp. IMCC34102]|uniref:aminotransferase class IV family protein n=1 Tax=Salipiger sp. IMCC34102 TaxID=2510647 RepID=UPI00101D4D27|nr:aminotransferase class IV family protein [Salipiger sp. IMCC34102]RYH01597.1 4-amino-4-deoxychorismate lyase [Salipiger sp. IMCC34102]